MHRGLLPTTRKPVSQSGTEGPASGVGPKRQVRDAVGVPPTLFISYPDLADLGCPGCCVGGTQNCGLG